MSKGAVSKRISNQLLKKLSSDFNKKTRKAAQTGRPQILQLKDLNFIVLFPKTNTLLQLMEMNFLMMA